MLLRTGLVALWATAAHAADAIAHAPLGAPTLHDAFAASVIMDAELRARKMTGASAT